MHSSTISAYEKFSQAYDEETADFWLNFPADFIDNFSRLVTQKDGKVLNVGSGPGRDAELLRERGLEIICLDAALAMVNLTTEKGFSSVQGDMLALPFEDSSFAGLWTYTCLLHIAREHAPKALKECARVLSPGAPLALGTIEGESNEMLKTTEKVRAPRLFTYYAMDEIQRLLSPYFEVVYTQAMRPNKRRYIHIIGIKK